MLLHYFIYTKLEIWQSQNYFLEKSPTVKIVNYKWHMICNHVVISLLVAKTRLTFVEEEDCWLLSVSWKHHRIKKHWNEWVNKFVIFSFCRRTVYSVPCFFYSVVYKTQRFLSSSCFGSFFPFNWKSAVRMAGGVSIFNFLLIS